MGIPNRIGVAGGPAKVKPLVGALKSGLINILVTDAVTAKAVLDFKNS
jgi:DNA-binding transcriptional regulator LsrR (DeoR family)